MLPIWAPRPNARGAVDGHHIQDLECIDRLGVTRYPFCKQGCGLALRQQIQIVIAGCAVGPQSHVNPGVQQ